MKNTRSRTKSCHSVKHACMVAHVMQRMRKNDRDNKRARVRHDVPLLFSDSDTEHRRNFGVRF